MKTAIQGSIRIVLFNLVPVQMITGVVNAIDIEAATYYVSPSGNDGNACTPGAMGSSARRHISAGLACLYAGDTLRIQAGTYTGASDRVDEGLVAFPGGSAGAPTIIEANPGDTVTLSPPINGASSEWHIVYITQSYVTVRNLVITGAYQYGLLVGVIGDHGTIEGNDICCTSESWLMAWGGTNGLIKNNRMHDARTNLRVAGGNQDGYACYCHFDGLIFDGNTFYNNGNLAIHWYGAGAGGIIRNNTFYNNGIDSATVGNPGLDVLLYDSSHQVYNNVFYGSPGGALRIVKSSSQVYNNTFYNVGNSGGLGSAIYLDGNSHVVMNNLILNTPTAIHSSGSNTFSNNISSGTASSIFTNVSAGDFTLKASSTPIDAGVTIDFIKTDRAGMPRPYGSVYDIGAYEFQGTSLTSIAPPSNLRVVP